MHTYIYIHTQTPYAKYCNILLQHYFGIKIKLNGIEFIERMTVLNNEYYNLFLIIKNNT